MKLGVNVDHVATLRQARKSYFPDPIEAALLAQDAGADMITIHGRTRSESYSTPVDRVEIKNGLETYSKISSDIIKITQSQPIKEQKQI